MAKWVGRYRVPIYPCSRACIASLMEFFICKNFGLEKNYERKYWKWSYLNQDHDNPGHSGRTPMGNEVQTPQLLHLSPAHTYGQMGSFLWPEDGGGKAWFWGSQMGQFSGLWQANNECCHTRLSLRGEPENNGRGNPPSGHSFKQYPFSQTWCVGRSNLMLEYT